MAVVSTEFVNVVETLVVFAVAGGIGEGTIYVLRRSGDFSLGRTRLLHQMIRVLWIGLAGLFALAIWGVTSDVLTALAVGVIALVISLGLQSTISNMVSGVFLLQDGAVRVGDYIEHFAIKGVVVRVALRNTWVRTETGQVAVIGNTKLADGPTLNRDLAARMEAARHAHTVPSLRAWRKPHAPPTEPAVPPK
jgi:small-conductance mechanosensitive channel